ncbi:MAG: flagellar protein FlgN [Clostridiales bacterium]|nr:flagellar protein FlgN [Clostridiales bacterium]
MGAYSEYIAFMEKYRDELTEVEKNERAKRQALLESDMAKLETIISTQQAQTMKLRSLEDKRIQLQEALSPETLTAREFLAGMDEGEDKRRLTALVREITALTESIKEQNKQALELAQTNFKILETVLQKDSFNQEKNVYGPSGGRRDTGTSGKTFAGEV